MLTREMDAAVAPIAGATVADTGVIDRQQPGRMRIGTSPQRMTPPRHWQLPKARSHEALSRAARRKHKRQQLNLADRATYSSSINRAERGLITRTVGHYDCSSVSKIFGRRSTRGR